jgi:hypothetical protein
MGAKASQNEAPLRGAAGVRGIGISRAKRGPRRVAGCDRSARPLTKSLPHVRGEQVQCAKPKSDRCVRTIPELVTMDTRCFWAAAYLALAACTSAPPGSFAASRTVPAAAIQRASGAIVADIHLTNLSSTSILFEIDYADSLRGLWLSGQHSCVHRGDAWDTKVNFDGSDPQLRLTAYLACEPRRGGRVTLRKISFTEGRAKIEGGTHVDRPPAITVCLSQRDGDSTCHSFR